MHRTLALVSSLGFLLLGSAGAQTFQSIFSFPSDGTKGKRPEATLTLGPGSFLYGTTVTGGTNDAGTVFKVSTDGVPVVLGSLTPATTGKGPYARLVSPGDGFLYGATEFNDGISGSPIGTVFKADPAGGLSVVFQLPGSGGTPARPSALLATDTATLKVLGSSPGGLWNVTTGGNGTSLYTFGDISIDGVFAYSLIKGSDGKLYGTTEGIGYVGTSPGARGTLFRINADGTGMTKLHDCVFESGVAPHGAMVEASDGNFYGTMSAGGDPGFGIFKKGTVFRLTPSGSYTLLHFFDDLAMPIGDLIQATDGYLYGTTVSGGSANQGGVFRIALDGSGYKIIQSFTGPNGARPRGGLVQAADGNLYGTTAGGGSGDVGTIFRVTLNLPPPNRPPVAIDDVGTAAPGNPSFVYALSNDFDPEGESISIVSVAAASFGETTNMGDGTIRYTPDPSFAGSDSFTYTIQDSGGLTATATVTIQSTPVTNYVYNGGYNGILYLDPELTGDISYPRAQLFVSINEFGGFSGFLVHRRARVPFRGAFDLSDGTAVARITLPTRKKAVLYLAFRQDEVATLIGLVFGSEIWSTNARPFILPSPPITTTQRYTVSLAGQGGDIPDGYGYATLQIKPTGVVSAVGKYGDGSKLAWVSILTTATDGRLLIPVFSEPVTGGACGGVLDSGVDPTHYDFGAALSWYRPASRKTTVPYADGFTGRAIAGVSRYVPKLKSDPISVLYPTGPDNIGVCFLDGSLLPAPIVASFGFGPTNVIIGAPLKRLTFNPKNGFVSGKMLNGTSVINFSGVVDQRNTFGVGLFMLKGIAGAMELN